MKRRTPKEVRKRTMITFILGILISGLGILLNEEAPLCMTGIVIMFASMIYHITFYRCPYCEKYLDRSTGEFCPHCGRKVNE